MVFVSLRITESQVEKHLPHLRAPNLGVEQAFKERVRHRPCPPRRLHRGQVCEHVLRTAGAQFTSTGPSGLLVFVYSSPGMASTEKVGGVCLRRREVGRGQAVAET